MRTPLQDVLSDHPDWEEPRDREAAEAQIEALFAVARDRSNAYSAARLDELYQVTERAITLAGAFPAAPQQGDKKGQLPWRKRLPQLVARYSSGLLLAASAPLVADASVLLAGACGIAAVMSLAFAGRADGQIIPRRSPRPKAVAAKLQGLLSAADQSLESATAPLAIEDQRSKDLGLPKDDVLSVLQDILAATRNAADRDTQELGRNAERLAMKAGYTPQWDHDPEFYEVMVDPEIEADLVLKPALVHRSKPDQSVFGVIVRRQG